MKRLLSYLLVFFASVAVYAQESKRQQVQSQELVLKAVELYQNGDISTAIKYLDTAIELDTANDAAHYYKGYLAALKNDARETVEQFEAAYRLDTTNVWYAMRLARVYPMVRKFAQARNILEKLSLRKPGDLEIISSLADVYIEESEYEKADSLLDRIEKIQGPNDYVDVTRIEIARQQGRYAELFDRLDEYFRRPDVPSQIKKDMMDRLLKGSDPRFNMVHLKDYVRLLDTSLESAPGDTLMLHFAGDVFFSIDRSDKLLELWSEHRDDLHLITLITYKAVNKGDYETGAEFAGRMIEFSDQSPESVKNALALQADSYFNLGRHTDAFRIYDILVKNYPRDNLLLNNYAYYMSILEVDLGKAARMSKKTITSEPDNAIYLDTYAWILYKQKKYKKAQEYMKRALIYGGKNNAEALSHYAAILEALGNGILAEGYRQQAAIRKNGDKK